jgi:tetratricopeptide (TPR) repeat protein
MSEWYLGDDWSQSTQQLFEQKLKKSRDSYNKAQYLRIKGTSLLKSKDVSKKEAGCELLKRVINEYPEELSSVKYAYELLGDYYKLKKDYSASEINYRKSISYYTTSGRSGTSAIGDLKLSELIIETDQEDKFFEMYELLKFKFFETKGSLDLNEDKYRYSLAMAQLSFKLGYFEEAKQYADIALNLAIESEPQFDAHPNLGIVKANAADIETLKVISKQIALK